MSTLQYRKLNDRWLKRLATTNFGLQVFRFRKLENYVVLIFCKPIQIAISLYLGTIICCNFFSRIILIVMIIVEYLE